MALSGWRGIGGWLKQWWESFRLLGTGWPRPLWDWLVSAGNAEDDLDEKPAKKLRRTMTTTMTCRYNASSRLEWQGRISFWTTVVFSLGLVFIALAQNAGIALAFKPSVVNMSVVFLSVLVLVYSAVTATAHYEVRAAKSRDCGDGIKRLVQELDAVCPGGAPEQASVSIKDIQQRYTAVVTNAENHSSNDYRFARLTLKKYYHRSGVPRLASWAVAWVGYLLPLAVPALLMVVEVAFIASMLCAPNLFTSYLGGCDILAQPTPAGSGT